MGPSPIRHQHEGREKREGQGELFNKGSGELFGGRERLPPFLIVLRTRKLFCSVAIVHLEENFMNRLSSTLH